jgi:uncharacterized protein (TIGR00369 family)
VKNDIPRSLLDIPCNIPIVYHNHITIGEKNQPCRYSANKMDGNFKQYRVQYYYCLYDTSKMRGEKVTTQESIRKIRQLFRRYPHDSRTIAGRIASRMKFVSYDMKAKTMEIDFMGDAEDLNPAGLLHGGVISTLMDMAMGILVIPIIDGAPPTVELNVSYLRPVKQGETLRFHARITHLGRTVIHTAADAVNLESGKVAASGRGMYFTKNWAQVLEKADSK